MGEKRRRLTARLKARVVEEALSREKSVNELASQYQVAPSQISTWKKEAIKRLPQLFESKTPTEASSKEAALYEQIGRLKMELEWLKKKTATDT